MMIRMNTNRLKELRKNAGLSQQVGTQLGRTAHAVRHTAQHGDLIQRMNREGGNRIMIR